MILNSTMPINCEKAIRSREGVNFVRSIVESAGWIFLGIEQGNDFGIDAIIEIFDAGQPTNQMFGIQIKSGNSYYAAPKSECKFPVGDHAAYWSNYPLPVIGVVYIPSLRVAYWIDIKRYLGDNPSCSAIRFATSTFNVFDQSQLVGIVLPTVTGQLPNLSFEECRSLRESAQVVDNYLAMRILFRYSINDLRVWDWFFDYFQTKEVDETPDLLIYYLAHIPWHGDIAHTGEVIDEQTKSHGVDRIENFRKVDVLKLLDFIDEENGISRGSIGQSVEAIISLLPDRIEILKDVIEDTGLSLSLRVWAALILAYYGGQDALSELESLHAQGSWYAGELHDFLLHNGWIDLYA